MKEDASQEFTPDTVRQSWVVREFEKWGTTQGILKANYRVMKTYYEHLKRYFRRPRLRPFWGLGEPEAMVAAFFVDRLERRHFFKAWLTHTKKKRLRLWLTNAFHLFLLEELKRAMKAPRPIDLQDSAVQNLLAVNDGEAMAEADRAFAEAVVEEVCTWTRASLEKDGLADHWHILYEHVVENRRYAELSREVGVTEDQARGMARTARDRYRKIFREILADDGAQENEIEDEIRDLEEVLAG
jgi:hypothetical protein